MSVKATGDAVSYAIFLIDQQTKKNGDEKETRVTNSLLNMDNVDISCVINL